MSNTKPQVIQLFVTCLVDAFYPNVGMSVVDILEAQGITVEFPFDQTCCGQPAFNGGFWDDARAMAKHTLDLLSATTGPIVIPSGSCADMIIHHYAELLHDDTQYAAKIKEISSRTYEFTQFLVDELGISDVRARCSGCATYHPSCHGLRNLGLKTQSKTLLSNIEGLKQAELPEAEECCGFGGLFAVKMSDISGVMLNRKLDHVQASGADILVGSDVSCLMHMAGGLQKRGSQIEVKHIAELLTQTR
ncbi:MAG: (Fe-S)-binding protein [Ardenticatenaceae bacterium]